MHSPSKRKKRAAAYRADAADTVLPPALPSIRGLRNIHPTATRKRLDVANQVESEASSDTDSSVDEMDVTYFGKSTNPHTEVRLDEHVSTANVPAYRPHTDFVKRVHLTRRELSAEAETRVRSAMAKPDGEVISTLDNVVICGSDLKTLDSGVWLNDQVINYYRALLQKTCDASASNPRVLITRTNFYTQLRTCGYSGVRRWMKALKKQPGAPVRGLCESAFDLDILIIPVHIFQSHWFCGAINFKKRRFEAYDSMGTSNVWFCDLMRLYMRGEWATVSNGASTLNLDEWTDYYGRRTPLQNNNFDCGAFTCQFMSHLCVSGGDDMPWTFSQADIPSIRKQMVRDIMA
jgi:sentrin-specific protease 1